jgi:hypothetical protein
MLIKCLSQRVSHSLYSRSVGWLTQCFYHVLTDLTFSFLGRTFIAILTNSTVRAPWGAYTYD